MLYRKANVLVRAYVCDLRLSAGVCVCVCVREREEEKSERERERERM